MVKLRTVEEHNELIRQLLANNTGKTGVECPQCKEELLHTGIMYTSHPPKQQVTCPNCNYIGSIL